MDNLLIKSLVYFMVGVTILIILGLVAGYIYKHRKTTESVASTGTSTGTSTSTSTSTSSFVPPSHYTTPHVAHPVLHQVLHHVPPSMTYPVLHHVGHHIR
jgi:hypothetical protein